MPRFYTLLACLLFSFAVKAQFHTISINGSASVFDTIITAITINDTRDLLQQACGCTVAYNDSTAPVQITLPDINGTEANKLNRFAQQAT